MSNKALHGNGLAEHANGHAPVSSRGKPGSGRRRRRRGHRRREDVGIWVTVFLALINAAALLTFDLVKDPLAPETYLGDDKIGHFIFFFIAAGVIGPLLMRWLSIGVNALVLVIFGLMIEIVQAYQPLRSPDFADFLADEAGIAAALIFLYVLRALIRWIRSEEVDDARR